MLHLDLQQIDILHTNLLSNENILFKKKIIEIL